MNPLQLEQLICGYLDDELSPSRKLEAKNLLLSDPAAQKLYEELMSIRNEIHNTRRHNLPFDFQKQLFERIDRETVSFFGKLVEQTTVVDFTHPVIAKPLQEQPNIETVTKAKTKDKLWRSKLLLRLKNPGVWVFPVIVLMIGFTFFVFYPGDRHLARIPTNMPSVVDDPVISPNDPDAPFFPPSPLDFTDSIHGNAANHGLAYQDGKPIVEVVLKLSPMAQDSQYIPKLLAERGFSYAIRQNGTKAVTVYEFEIPTDRLLPLISLMYSSPGEILEYKLPDGILTLLHRPADSSFLEPTTESTVIVRLNASDK